MPIIFLEWKIFIFYFFSRIVNLHYFLTLKRSNWFFIYNLIKITKLFCIDFMLCKVFFLFTRTKKTLILSINLILLTFSYWLSRSLNIIASQTVSSLIFYHFSLIIRLSAGCHFFQWLRWVKLISILNTLWPALILTVNFILIQILFWLKNRVLRLLNIIFLLFCILVICFVKVLKKRLHKILKK
jgi:hypothetical protein